MMTENRFNLIDEPWIPVVNVGLVSLKQIFTDKTYRALGGNPVEKIALTKLLLAIAQAACTPQDEETWSSLGSTGLAEHCLDYLEKWHDRFYLYGERPFLQMPAIIKAKMQSLGAVMPKIATGNTTVLTQEQIERSCSDAQKTLIIITLMGFSLGGKKVDNSQVLSPGYKEKKKAGKPGPSLGLKGFQHHFLLTDSIQTTLWLNLLTEQHIAGLKILTKGLGVAPWEQMPQGEACSIAHSLKESLMGRLVPLSRFCLLSDNGLHYSEGLQHPDYRAGQVDPTVAVSNGKKPKVLWVNPDKRPWRELVALLSFMVADKQGFDCHQLACTLDRARQYLSNIFIWSGGMKVSYNSGEQYLSGDDDFVESLVRLESHWLGESWYKQLEKEMDILDKIGKSVYVTTQKYYQTQGSENKAQARKASHLFWQLCERQFQHLLKACNGGSQEAITILRRRFIGLANQAYNTFCPKATARQLDAWAHNQPKL